MLDGATETPFECSSTDRGDGGLRTIWRFELPEAQGVLTIRAECASQSLGGGKVSTTGWSMDCLWQRSPAAVFVSGRQSEETEVLSGRTVRMQVFQEGGECRVRVSAPWNRGVGGENRLVSTGGASQGQGGVLEFECKGRDGGGLVQKAVLISTESIVVEPRSLFEVENRLEARKRQWVRDEQSRLELILSEYLAMGTNREVNRWAIVSASQTERLRGLEQGLACWAEAWDSAITVQQFRVGNRLVGHPDR